MASVFDKLRKNTKLGSAWKKARKSEGFKAIQSKPGDYTGKLKIDPKVIDKGPLEGCPVIRFICTVVEPDEASGQSNTRDYIFADDADQTLESLARDMKFMFPGHKDEIAKASFEELLTMLEDLADDLHDVEFRITSYKPKAGKNKGVDVPVMYIGVVTIADSDESDDDGEEEDEEDEEEEAPKTKSKSKAKPKAEEDDEEEEDDDDTDDDDEEEEDEEEDESDYVPEKGDLVKVGRSTYKVTAVQSKAKTATLKNVKTDTIVKGKEWAKLVPAEDDDE
jgi:hypothetical protein